MSRKALLAAVAGLAVGGALALPSPAAAAPSSSASPATAKEAAGLSAATGVDTATATARIAAQSKQSALAGTLSKKLGAKAAGSYLDAASGRLVVAVTDAAAASTVRASGAEAKVVQRSTADLNKVTAALPRTAGTSYGVDTKSNQVVVTITKGASASGASALTKAAAKYGTAVRMQRTGSGYTTQLQGGEAIYTDTGGRCSAGFNTTGGVVTAGHCTAGYPSWTVSGGGYLGESAGSSFPGNDYGLITNSGQPASGSVYLYGGGSQPITGAGDAVVGQSICKSGSTTGVTCGTVQAVNVTVNYAEGSVYGTVQTNVCTQPGDSGGSWYSGSTAIGITSGGTIGGCGAGFQSFFQPVTEALSAYGVSLI